MAVPGKTAPDVGSKRGPVAQLDRASVFGTEGWGFEPLRGRQYLPLEIHSHP